eukprot:4562779-Amphidinium_carterae.1
MDVTLLCVGTVQTKTITTVLSDIEENRRIYRQMLYTAKGANKYLSAAILDPETVFQRQVNLTRASL